VNISPIAGLGIVGVAASGVIGWWQGNDGAAGVTTQLRLRDTSVPGTIKVVTNLVVSGFTITSNSLQLSAVQSQVTFEGTNAGFFATNNGGTVKIYGMNSAGTTFLLTPHATDSPATNLDLTDPDPIVFNESNPYLGRERWIHLSAMAEAVQELTGKQFMFTNTFPKLKWAKVQNERQLAYDVARTNALARYNSPFTNAAGEVFQVNTNIVVPPVADIRIKKPESLRKLDKSE